MERGRAGRRILDADVVADILADREIVEVAGAAAIFQRRLHPVVGSDHRRDLAAGIGRAGLHRDVDHTGGAQAVLGGQGAGDQRELVGKARRHDVAEQGQPLGKLHAVEPVLQAAMVAADMDLAEAVLHDAGRPQQHLVERGVLAERRVADRRLAEIVAGRAEARLDLAALAVEPLADHLDREPVGWNLRGRLGRGRLRHRRSERRETCCEGQCGYADPLHAELHQNVIK